MKERFNSLPPTLQALFIFCLIEPFWSLTFIKVGSLSFGETESIIQIACHWVLPLICAFGIWTRNLILMPAFLAMCIGYVYLTTSANIEHPTWKIIASSTVGLMCVLGAFLTTRDFLYPLLTKKRTAFRSATRITQNVKVDADFGDSKIVRFVMQDISTAGMSLMVSAAGNEELIRSMIDKKVNFTVKGQKYTGTIRRCKVSNTLLDVGIEAGKDEFVDLMKELADTSKTSLRQWWWATSASKRALFVGWSLSLVGTLSVPACGTQDDDLRSEGGSKVTSVFEMDAGEDDSSADDMDDMYADGADDMYADDAGEVDGGGADNDGASADGEVDMNAEDDLDPTDCHKADTAGNTVLDAADVAAAWCPEWQNRQFCEGGYASSTCTPYDLAAWERKVKTEPVNWEHPWSQHGVALAKEGAGLYKPIDWIVKAAEKIPLVTGAVEIVYDGTDTGICTCYTSYPIIGNVTLDPITEDALVWTGTMDAGTGTKKPREEWSCDSKKVNVECPHAEGFDMTGERFVDESTIESQSLIYKSAGHRVFTDNCCGINKVDVKRLYCENGEKLFVMGDEGSESVVCAQGANTACQSLCANNQRFSKPKAQWLCEYNPDGSSRGCQRPWP